MEAGRAAGLTFGTFLTCSAACTHAHACLLFQNVSWLYCEIIVTKIDVILVILFIFTLHTNLSTFYSKFE